MFYNLLFENHGLDTHFDMSLQETRDSFPEVHRSPLLRPSARTAMSWLILSLARPIHNASVYPNRCMMLMMCWLVRSRITSRSLTPVIQYRIVWVEFPMLWRFIGILGIVCDSSYTLCECVALHSLFWGKANAPLSTVGRERGRVRAGSHFPHRNSPPPTRR